MRKNTYIHSLILFLSLVMPFCLALAWFQGQVYDASQSGQKIISQDFKVEDYIVLRFSIEDAKAFLEWEHPHEFEFKGEMYDIAKTDLTIDSVVYYCYHDKRETHYKKKLKDFLTHFIRHGHQSKKHQQYAKEFFKSIYFQNENPGVHFITMIENQENPAYFDSHYVVIKFGPPVPPPRNLS